MEESRRAGLHGICRCRGCKAAVSYTHLSKKIDVVWNGMTLTDEVTKSMECTNAYCNNAQVVVEREKSNVLDCYTSTNEWSVDHL